MYPAMREGYQIVSTDEIIRLLAEGHKVTLPPAFIEDPSIRLHYSDEDIAKLGLFGDLNNIVSVEYIGEEEVQCIAVDDPEHLYLTDGFIPTHNTSNIVFLKSTDDAMIETLEKMSGKRHQAYTDSKQVSRDISKVWMRNSSTTSYTMSVRELPVISYNDLAFISERNSIVFRAGDSPIWNRNETILPMSWRLFANKINQPGRDYTLQTIPTLSSAIDFDIRKNQPNFDIMLNKRISQSVFVEDAKQEYQDLYGYDDYDIAQLDPDSYADQILDIVNVRSAAEANGGNASSDKVVGPVVEKTVRKDTVEDNNEVRDEVLKQKAEQANWEKPRYARYQGQFMLSRDDLVPNGPKGAINGSFKDKIGKVCLGLLILVLGSGSCSRD